MNALLSLLLTWIALQASPRRDVELLIDGGVVVTVDPHGTVHDPGFVAFRGDRIVAVGPAREAGAFRPRARIDAKGHLVMPGLINTHGHAAMTLFRGVADDLELMDWLKNYIWPAEARNVNADFVRWGTRLAAAEMIRSGTSLFVDMYYFEEEVARAAKEAGMRAVAGETVLDFPAPDFKTAQEALQYTDGFIRRWKKDPLVIPAVAPHAPYTCSKETLLASKQLADRHSVPLLIHLAESRDEIEQVRARHGTTSTAYLQEIGFLEDRVLAAHVIFVTREEIDLLARAGVGVSHNPESNMKLGSGVSPVPELLAAGIAVGLGTDGAASNNNLDLFEAMDFASKLHKIHRLSPTVLQAREVVRMATVGGAAALNLEDQLGSLEVGKKADLVLLDLNRARAQPLYSVYSQLVYALKGSDVRSVWIDGKPVLRDGRLLNLDEPAILEKAREFQRRIRASLMPAQTRP